LDRLTAEQAARLVEHLTELPLHATATEGFGKAMVTRGGVALKEIYPETLESRIVKGLYFAGEVVDLDGPCGGYNLQWAFSSGLLAGRSAAAGFGG
jgi:predicted flavoprotein YhiN